MATYLDNLKSRRLKITAAIDALVPGEGMDKPEHTGEDHVAYVSKLNQWNAELTTLDALIEKEQGRQVVETFTYGNL